MAPRVEVRALRGPEGKRLLSLVRQAKDAIASRRAEIILAAVQGDSPPEIAERLFFTPDHVRKVIHAFNGHGVDSLRAQYTNGDDQITLMSDSALNLGTGAYGWDYDSDGRRVREIAPEGAVVSYTYDADDRRDGLIDPDGNVTAFDYDADGGLAEIQNGFGQMTTYSRDNYRRVTGVDYWNGTSTTVGYDAFGRLVDRIVRDSSADVAQRFRYGYDAGGNVLRTTFAHDTGNSLEKYVLYSYDALNRLTMEQWREREVIYAQGEEEVYDDYRLWQRNYVHDAVGNRTALGYHDGSTTTTVTYTHNSLNQLTQMSAGTYRYFSYDANGNLLSRTEAASGAGSGNGWFYTWSQDDRLTNVALVVDEKVGIHRQTTFAYDAGGRRLLRQDDDGTWTRYFYDGLNVLLEREATSDPSTWDEVLLVDAEGGGTGDYTIWDDDPSGSTLTNVLDSGRGSRVVEFDAASGTDNGAMTTPNWNAAEGPVITFQRRSDEADIRIWTSTSAGTRVFQFGTWVGSPSYNSGNGWHALPLPAGVNDGEWEELTVDLQEILDNLSSGTLTDIDKIEWRGDAAFDTVRVGAARTTKIYTLAPSALGGIISIRELERDTYYDTDNVDTWYHCDRLGSVALTSDSAGASNGLRWQDAYGNQLASVSNGGWASAAASEGYGLTTKEFDGDVELYYFWQRWLDPTLGIFVSSAPLSAHLEHPFGYAESNPVLRIDPDGNVSRPVAEQCLKEAKDQPNPSYGACGTAAAVDCHQARQCLRRYGIDPNNEVPCRFEICGFPSAGRVCVHAWCCVKCD